jgi:hypothetical protein
LLSLLLLKQATCLIIKKRKVAYLLHQEIASNWTLLDNYMNQMKGREGDESRATVQAPRRCWAEHFRMGQAGQWMSWSRHFRVGQAGQWMSWVGVTSKIQLCLFPAEFHGSVNVIEPVS